MFLIQIPRLSSLAIIEETHFHFMYAEKTWQGNDEYWQGKFFNLIKCWGSSSGFILKRTGSSHYINLTTVLQLPSSILRLLYTSNLRLFYSILHIFYTFSTSITQITPYFLVCCKHVYDCNSTKTRWSHPKIRIGFAKIL